MDLILISHQQIQRRMLVFKWLHQTKSKRMLIAEITAMDIDTVIPIIKATSIIKGADSARGRTKKKEDLVPTYNMDSPLGSEFESDDDPNNDNDLKEAQAGVTFGKK